MKKIRIDLGDVIVEAEREPMPEARFKTVCRLIFVCITAAATIAALALVGVYGLVLLVPAGIVGLCSLAD